MIKGIIFDLDGVLVDAVNIHFEAFNSAIKLFGYEVPSLIHSVHYNGLPTSSKLELLTQTQHLPRGLHSFINEMKQKHTKEALHKKIYPRKELNQNLKWLRDKGYKLAVASNCTRETVNLVLRRLSITDFFDVILSRSDVNLPKPSEEIFLKCQYLLGLNPDETLIIEDSIPGITAAQKASPHVLILKSPEELSISKIEKAIEAANSVTFKDFRTVEIVIPMAGSGSRFFNAGFKDPKPLIKIFNKPMIHWVIDNLKSKQFRTRFTFIVNKNHLERYSLRQHLNDLAPGSRVVSVPERTEGAACTVLLSLENLPMNSPLIIANSDQYVDHSFDHFLKHCLISENDGVIMTFPDTDPKWSFAKTNSMGNVVQVAEKNPISDQATVGIYYFSQVKLFKTSCMEMIRKNQRVNGEFYVCPVYNEIIEKDHKVGIYSIRKQDMHGLGTPADLQNFINLHDDINNRVSNLSFG